MACGAAGLPVPPGPPPPPPPQVSLRYCEAHLELAAPDGLTLVAHAPSGRLLAAGPSPLRLTGEVGGLWLRQVEGPRESTPVWVIPPAPVTVELRMEPPLAIAQDGQVELTWLAPEEAVQIRVYRDGKRLGEWPASQPGISDVPGPGPHRYAAQALTSAGCSARSEEVVVE